MTVPEFSTRFPEYERQIYDLIAPDVVEA